MIYDDTVDYSKINENEISQMNFVIDKVKSDIGVSVRFNGNLNPVYICYLFKYEDVIIVHLKNNHMNTKYNHYIINSLLKTHVLLITYSGFIFPENLCKYLLNYKKFVSINDDKINVDKIKVSSVCTNIAVKLLFDNGICIASSLKYVIDNEYFIERYKDNFQLNIYMDNIKKDIVMNMLSLKKCRITFGNKLICKTLNTHHSVFIIKWSHAHLYDIELINISIFAMKYVYDKKVILIFSDTEIANAIWLRCKNKLVEYELHVNYLLKDVKSLKNDLILVCKGEFKLTYGNMLLIKNNSPQRYSEAIDVRNMIIKKNITVNNEPVLIEDNPSISSFNIDDYLLF